MNFLKQTSSEDYNKPYTLPKLTDSIKRSDNTAIILTMIFLKSSLKYLKYLQQHMEMLQISKYLEIGLFNPHPKSPK